MRPRFSLRWLLLVFTLLTVAFYLLFVSPTFVADRLIAASDRDDLSELKPWLGVPPVLRIRSARLQPREWSDVWRFQRRFTLRFDCLDHGKDGTVSQNTRELDIATGPTGVKTVQERAGGGFF